MYFATAGEKGVVRAWRVGSAKPVAKSASLRAGQSSAAAHTGQADEEHGSRRGNVHVAARDADRGRALAVTGDARLLFYGDDDVETDAPAGKAGSIVVKRELIGNTDEIISAAFLTTDPAGPRRRGRRAVGGGGGGGGRSGGLRDVELARARARGGDEQPPSSACVRSEDDGVRGCSLGAGPGAPSPDAAAGPDGEALVLTGSRDHTVRLWDPTPAARRSLAGRTRRTAVGTGARGRMLGRGASPSARARRRRPRRGGR